jgi:hypothetical protein
MIWIVPLYNFHHFLKILRPVDISIFVFWKSKFTPLDTSHMIHPSYIPLIMDIKGKLSDVSRVRHRGQVRRDEHKCFLFWLGPFDAVFYPVDADFSISGDFYNLSFVNFVGRLFVEYSSESEVHFAEWEPWCWTELLFLDNWTLG